MTASISTVRPPDFRLGGPINEQTEAERRANSKGSLGMLVEVTKEVMENKEEAGY